MQIKAEAKKNKTKRFVKTMLLSLCVLVGAALQVLYIYNAVRLFINVVMPFITGLLERF